MGSFSSAPRLVNPDSQDDSVELPGADSGVAKRWSQSPGQGPGPVQGAQEELSGWCARQLESSPARLLDRRMLPVGVGHSHLAPAAAADKAGDANTIRVMQWNVLSQALGRNSDNFVACPDGALEWDVRRALMLQELASMDADIICLQEVDHFKVMERALGPLGYRGLWEPKPDSPCLYLPDNNGPDGCALLWRSDRFALVEDHRATLHVWRIPSNQVVLLAVLRHLASGTEVCVATTHLKARAGALMSTLRNEQGRDLLRLVSAHAAGRPVILAGDFNAEPEEPVYRTILQHPTLGLASVYSKATYQEQASSLRDRDRDRDAEDRDSVSQSAAGEPPYTTWKVREEGEQCHTIDYIFVSQPSFTVSALLDFPSGDQLGEGRAPSYRYPSDHFSLCADLRLRDVRPASRCNAERSK